MPEIELEDLSAIISDVYDCALDPSQWSATLDQLNLMFGSAFAAIFLAQNDPFLPLAYFHSSWDQHELQRLVYEFAPGIPGVVETLTGPIGQPVSLLNRLDESGMSTHLQSRFFREWVQPQGLHDACLTKVCQTSNRSGMFQLIGKPHWDACRSGVERLIELLLPHLRRAIMIADLLDQSHLKLEAYQSTINLMAAPIILLDANRKICHANPAAQRFLESGSMLRELNGRLTIAEIATRRAFEASLALSSAGDRAIGTQGIGIPLHAEGGYPAVCYLLPINTSTGRQAHGNASVALFISTQAHAVPTPAPVLATLFGLTSAESHLASEMRSGESVDQIANRIGISPNTAKTHLKRIYEKTSTQRRGELIALVRNLSPVAASYGADDRLKVART